MKAIVKYIDFHIDNYQGASGRTVEASMTLNIPDNLLCSGFFDFMHDNLTKHLNERRPFGTSEHGYKPTIVSVEIV